MFHMTRSFLTVGEDLFEVLRVIEEKNVHNVDEWKNHFGVDRVFRKDGRLFFANLIKEAEILEETFFEKDKN